MNVKFPSQTLVKIGRKLEKFTTHAKVRSSFIAFSEATPYPSPPGGVEIFESLMDQSACWRPFKISILMGEMGRDEGGEQRELFHDF